MQNQSCGCSTNSQSSCGCSTGLEADSLCPTCGVQGLHVSGVTLKAQLKKELFEKLYSSEDFNFCNNPTCNTVYYRKEDKLTFSQEDIKSKVTIKNDDENTPLCYCKKLLKKDFYKMVEDGEEDIGAKIKAIIAGGKSFCEKSNPKGICCIEDVNIFLEEHGMNQKKENMKSGCC